MSASSAQNKAGWGGEYGRHVPWEVFDRLPWPIKELFCFAAYNYTPAGAVAALEKGRSVEEIVSHFRPRMRRRMQAEALRLYGPEHPQARPWA